MKKKLKELIDDFSDEIDLMVVLVFYSVVGGIFLSYLLWVLLDYPALF
ncbi:hypothetical protein [uncultured Gammaproteobacteria bacterium]|nr:hypothetical protein [uncultured Gammaproteobacteria bacterium]CAC9981626.1 hypothetical protein [uncultured Gammaproteobacteria bacterium]